MHIPSYQQRCSYEGLIHLPIPNSLQHPKNGVSHSVLEVLRGSILQAESVFSNVYGTSGTENLRLVRQTAGNYSVEYVHDIYGRVLTETRNIEGEPPLDISSFHSNYFIVFQTR